MRSGIDPEIMLAGLELAGFHVEAGARKFAAFTKAMVEDLGDAARPYLKGWYLAVRNYPGFDNAGMNTEAEITAEEALSAKPAAMKRDSPPEPPYTEHPDRVELDRVLKDKRVRAELKVNDVHPESSAAYGFAIGWLAGERGVTPEEVDTAYMERIAPGQRGAFMDGHTSYEAIVINGNPAGETLAEMEAKANAANGKTPDGFPAKGERPSILTGSLEYDEINGFKIGDRAKTPKQYGGKVGTITQLFTTTPTKKSAGTSRALMRFEATGEGTQAYEQHHDIKGLTGIEADEGGGDLFSAPATPTEKLKVEAKKLKAKAKGTAVVPAQPALEGELIPAEKPFDANDPTTYEIPPRDEDEQASDAQLAKLMAENPLGVPAVNGQLFVVASGGVRFPVNDLVDASRKWNEYRDRSMEAGGEPDEIGGGVKVVDQDGKEIASISWNGRVWPPGEWKPGQKPFLESADYSPAPTVDADAHDAATSPTNDRPEPTEPQQEAGNYKKGHVRVAGLDISIENPEGSTRSGKDGDGEEWSVTMTAHYGYIRGTKGVDKEHIDVYIAPGTSTDYDGLVFVVDQYPVGGKKIDEHKVIIGVNDFAEAQKLYDAHFSDGSGPKRRVNVNGATMDAFKDWLENGDHTTDFADYMATRAPQTYDFVETFPFPTNGDYAAEFFDGVIAGEERDELRFVHNEQAGEMLGSLRGIDAVAEALKTGIDPKTGKRPKTPAAAAKLKKELEADARTLPENYADALGAYAHEFGLVAGDAFDKHVRAVYAAERAAAPQTPADDLFSQPEQPSAGGATLTAEAPANAQQPPSETGNLEGDRQAGQDSGRDSGPLGGGLAHADEGDGSGRDPDIPPEGSGGGRGGRNRATQSGRGKQPSGGRGAARARRDKSRPVTGPVDYTITDADDLGAGGAKTKYRGNVAAIQLLKELEAESLKATPDEQRVLARYVGWGGLKAVFDPANKEWAKEYAELKDLLTPEEYEAARATILNAHYTSVPVVRGIHAALARMGFHHGRILEPAIGTGNFIGLMPPEMRADSAVFGVELDDVTGRIVKQLYQRADIASPRGFQEVKIPDGYFDVAIGNPPFGSEQVFDRDHPDLSKFSIHNFFFAKSIEKLRPGGVLSMVVSHYFMDQQDSTVRQWIDQRARLVGAVRLPNTAFKQNAGTEVVTDIIFLQKREPDEVATEGGAEWVKADDLELEGGKARVNAYFLANPRMVLGRHALTGTMYRDNDYTVEPTGDLAAQLAAAVENLPEKIYQHPAKRIEVLTDVNGLVPDTAKVGSYFRMPDGSIARRIEDAMNKQRFEKVEIDSDITKARILGMIRIREALRAVMREEMESAADTGSLLTKRATLNRVYDEYVKKYGFINGQANRRAFADDVDVSLIEALEPDYDPGVSAAVAKKSGAESRAPSARKADIFSKRVLSPASFATSVDSPKDALVAALNQSGRVDMDLMERLSGTPRETLQKELAGLIFKNPTGDWETADQYLSGNVKEKLASARRAASHNPEYAPNVTALENVQPAPIPAVDISVRLGSPWVPASDIAAFAEELLQGGNAHVAYMASVARWSFSHDGGSSVAKRSTWGTPRVTADQVIESLLNTRPIQVKDNVGSSREPVYVVNETETQAAQAKADDVARKFKDWIWQDQARRDRLEQFYNEKYNTNIPRKYDGSHLTLPGMTPFITLRPSQKNAIWRGIQDRTLLLDHVVGAGKTYTKIAIAMEMRRLGIIRKPMFTVPNYLVRQWRDAFLTLYPSANILATTEKDFEKQNRKRLFSKITTGDWDAVIVGHSSFKKVGMPPAQEQEILGEMMRDVAGAIEEIKRERGDKNVIRDMERIKASLDAKFKRLSAKTGDKDDVVTFDELGVDGLFVDEAHLFKNLFYFTQMARVAGLGNPAGSGRAFDMFVKLRFLQTRQGQRGVSVFATGTPVSNSLVEMFTMQRFLMYDDLKERGIHLLDAWARVFGDVQQVYEVHPSGSGYRLASRFAKFVNMPELMALYKGVADVITIEDLKAQAAAQGKRFPVPNKMGGKPQMRVAERSELQTRFFGVPEFVRTPAGEIEFEGGDLRVMRVGDTTSSIRDRFKDKHAHWAVVFGEPGRESFKEGPFETRIEAVREANSLMTTPKVQYNQGSILWKFENLRELTKRSDGKVNALSITNEARKAGLDYRLIDPNAPDFPGSKLNMAVTETLRIHGKWAEDRGTQLIFCDLSVPASAREKILKQASKQQEKEAAEGLENDAAEEAKAEGDALEQEEEAVVSMDQLLATQSRFSVYDDLKAKLIAGGIPENEIAFIHDYDTAIKKGKLFAAVNRGDIRVLIGSTEKMGAGMNVQERLVGIHHLDAPWRPSDLEQRNGRIDRQGNALYERDPDGFETEEIRYATKQTYDTRMWQIIEHKAKGVEQLRHADETSRTIDDISGEAASSADMKAAASGNPLILEEIKLRNTTQSLEAQEANFNRNLFDMQRRATWLAEAPKRYAEREKRTNELKAAVQAKPKGEEFTAVVGAQTITDRKAFGGALIAQVGAIVKEKAGEWHAVLQYRGITVLFSADKDGLGAKGALLGETHYFGSWGKGDDFSPTGVLQRVDNWLDSIGGDLPRYAQDRDSELKELEQVREEVKKPFERKAELESARTQHREVVNKLKAAGGSVSLTPAMQAELEQARSKKRPIPEEGGDAAFSRGAGAAGITLEDLKAVVANVTRHWRNAPRVNTLERPEHAEKDLWRQIRASRAEGIVQGAYHDGEIYLFARNIADPTEAETVVLHEATHYGLEGALGDQLRPAMMEVWRLNAKVQVEAAKLRAKYPDLSHSGAVWEVLADMGAAAPRLKGWARFVEAVKNLARRFGLARWLGIAEQDRGDKLVVDLLAAARRYYEGKPISGGKFFGRTAFMRMPWQKPEAPAPAAPMETGEVQARPGVNAARLARLLGPQLYGEMSSLGEVTVKELFQNSFDAAKGAIERGGITAGKVDVTVDTEKREIGIVDNGTGMTPEQINGAFLTLAGTQKESTRSSGGLGIAKMLFLFGNERLELVTTRDGVESTLVTSGADLLRAFDEPEGGPKITTRRTGGLSGTRITVRVPASYTNQDGEVKEIRMPLAWSAPESIRRSALFESVDVTFNGTKVKVGANFPERDYVPLSAVKFPWGTARIVITKEESTAFGSRNVDVLSNGVWQFSRTVKEDPFDMWGPSIPRHVIINVESDVKPDEPNYPFALNRQSFSSTTASDVDALLHYLSVLYRKDRSAENAKGFGALRYVEADGTLSEPQQLAPKVEKRDLGFVINPSDRMEVREGRVFLNGKPLPVLTKDEIQKFNVDLSKYKVDQDALDPRRLMVHDNASIGGNMLSDIARKRFPKQFDRFVAEMGGVFRDMRDAIAKEAGYEDVARVPVGVSFDKAYRGVHTTMPFRAMFINPAVPVYRDLTRAAVGIVGTMAHEIAHFKEWNHNDRFAAEMQNIDIMLSTSQNIDYASVKSGVRELLSDNLAIFEWLYDAFNSGNVENAGSQLKDGAQQTRDEGPARDTAGAGAGRSNAAGVPESASSRDQGAGRSAEREGSDRAAQERGVAAFSRAGQREPVDITDSMRRAEAALTQQRTRFRPLDATLRAISNATGFTRLTGKAYDLMTKLGSWVPPKWKAGIVSDYGMPEAVVDRRDVMFGTIRQKLRQGKHQIERLMGLTRGESRIAYEWMNGRDAEGLIEQLPEDSRQALRELRDWITEMGAEAVRLGQLSADAYDRNKFAYLHRSYLKYETDEGPQAKANRARAIRILGDQYKGRGILDPVSMSKVQNAVGVEFWQRMVKPGEADRGLKGQEFIRLERRARRGEAVAVLAGIEQAEQPRRLLEVAYWPATMAVPRRYEGWDRDPTLWKVIGTQGDKLLMHRDFTAAERQAMGEIDEVRFAAAKTLQLMIHDVETGRYLEWLANTQARPEAPRNAEVVEASERMAATFLPGTWVQVPDSKIPGTQTYRYGKLQGLFIPGPIWNDVRQLVNHRYQPLGETYATLLRAWKISKTALSPAVHMNNVMANVVMADWHDVGAPHLLAALRVIVNGDDPVNARIRERFEDAGGAVGTFALSELQREQLKPLLEALRADVERPVSGMLNASAVLQAVMAGRYREAIAAAQGSKAAGGVSKGAGAMIDLYQAEDVLFRLAAFIKAKGEGATDLEAGKLARRSFLDYNINAPWIQAMRATAFPFISFTYRAIPMLLDVAAHKPWKLMKMAVMLGLANALGYAVSGGDEDEERKLLPDEKAGRIYGFISPKLLRMPWNDQHGSPVFLDIRRFVPLGDIADLGQTHSAIPVVPFALPGGPLAVLAELVLNRSQFTGREVTKNTDTALERAGKIIDHLWKAMAPNLPMLPYTHSATAIANAGTGRTDTFGREQSLPMAAVSSVGVRLAAYPADQGALNARMDYQSKVREIDANIGALRRELARNGISREEFERRVLQQVNKKLELSQKFREKVGAPAAP